MAEYVAQIGTTKYETLAAAFSAVSNGGTIELLSDCTVTSKLNWGTTTTRGCTIQMNGHTITGTAAVSGGVIEIRKKQYIKLEGGGEVKSTNSAAAINATYVQSGGYMSVDGVNLTSTGGSAVTYFSQDQSVNGNNLFKNCTITGGGANCDAINITWSSSDKYKLLFEYNNVTLKAKRRGIYGYIAGQTQALTGNLYIAEGELANVTFNVTSPARIAEKETGVINLTTDNISTTITPVVQDEKGNITVGNPPADYDAIIVGKPEEYKQLAAAVEASEAGDTIQLARKVELKSDSDITIADRKLDTNSFTLNTVGSLTIGQDGVLSDDSNNGGTLEVGDGGELNVIGNGNVTVKLKDVQVSTSAYNDINFGNADNAVATSWDTSLIDSDTVLGAFNVNVENGTLDLTGVSSSGKTIGNFNIGTSADDAATSVTIKKDAVTYLRKLYIGSDAGTNTQSLTVEAGATLDVADSGLDIKQNGVITINGNATFDISDNNGTINLGSAGHLTMDTQWIYATAKLTNNGAVNITVDANSTTSAWINAEEFAGANGTITVDMTDAVWAQDKQYLLIDAWSTSVTSDYGTYSLVGSDDYTLSVVDGDLYAIAKAPVAQIGDTKYTSLAKAYAAAQSGDTIKLLVNTIDSIAGIPAGVTLEGVADKTTVTSELGGTLNGVTLKNIKFTTGGNAIYYAYCGAGQTFTLDNCVIAPTGRYGIHFDGNANGSVVVKNSEVSGSVALASTITTVSFSDTEFIGKNKSTNCNINLYQNATFTDCTFSDDYCSGSKRGILMLMPDGETPSDSVVVELNGCTLSNPDSQYKITDIIRRDYFNLAAFDATGTTGSYTAGTFVAKDVASLNAVCDDSIDITFLDAGNYEGTVLYTVSGDAKTVTAEGSIIGDVSVPEGVVLAGSDTLEIADGIKITLADRSCMATGDYVLPANSIILINEYMDADELAAWKAARKLDDTEIVRPLENIIDAPTQKTVSDPVEEGGKTYVTVTDQYIVNLDVLKTRVDDVTAPEEQITHDPVVVGTTVTTYVEPKANIIINNYTTNAEVRGDIEQKSELWNITVNNNADKATVTEEKPIDLAITGSLKAVNQIIINNNDAAVLNGGAEERGFVAEAAKIELNNEGHAVVDLTATDVVTIKNVSANTLVGNVTAPNIVFDRTGSAIVTDGSIENATITATTSLTFNDKQYAINSQITSQGTLTVASTGALTVDKDSTLTVSGITTVNAGGAITVDAEGFYGRRKVVDLSNGTGASNLVNVINDTGVTVTRGEDGDVTLFRANLTDLAVDDSWTNKTLGEEVTLAGKTYYFGYNAFTTIQEAVNAADATKGVATINVANGTYNENVTLQGKENLDFVEGEMTYHGNLYFKAESKDVVLNGQITSGNGVSDNLANITIEGFTINSTTQAIYLDNSTKETKNILIKNNTITSDGTGTDYPYGIYIIPASMSNIVVTGNTINSGYAPIGIGGYTATTGSNIEISNNDITSTSGAMRVMGKLSNTSITGNNFHTSWGIWINNSVAALDAGAITVSGNTLDDTTGSWFLAYNNNGLTTKGSIVIGADNKYGTNVIEAGWADPAVKIIAAADVDSDGGCSYYYQNKLYLAGDAAFANTKDALTEAAANPGTTVDFTDFAYKKVAIVTSGEGVCFNKGGTYTLTGGSGALFNYELQLNSNKADNVTVSMNINAAKLTASKVNLYTNSTMSIKDSTLDFLNFEGGAAYFGVKKNSSLTIDNSTVGNRTADDACDGPNMQIYGTVTVNASTLYVGHGQGNPNEGLNVLGNGTMTVKDSTVNMAFVNLGNIFNSGYFYGTVPATTSSSIVLDNAKMYNTQYKGDGNSRTDGIIIGDGSTHYGTLTLKNGSVINLTVTDVNNLNTVTINSNGAVNMDAASQIKLGSITNSGTITVDMTGATADSYKLVDAAAASNYGFAGTNYKFAEGKDNYYVLTVKDNDLYAEKHYVCKIGDTKYVTLEAAVAAVQNDETITLLEDITLADCVNVSEAKSFTVDLAGYTISSTATCANGSAFNIGVKGQSVAANVTLTNGTIDGTAVTETECDAITVRNGATVTLTDLTVKVDSAAGACAYAFEGGKVYTNGGTYQNLTTESYPWATGKKALIFNQYNGSTQSIFIQEGTYTFVGQDPEKGDDSGLVTTFIGSDVTAAIAKDGSITYYNNLTGTDSAYAAAVSGDTVRLLVSEIDRIDSIPSGKSLTVEGVTDKTTVTGDNQFSGQYLNNVTLKNFKFTADSTDKQDGAIRWAYLTEGTTFTLENCEFDQYPYYALHFDGNPNGKVVATDTIFRDTVALAAGITAEFTGCEFRSNSHYADVGLSLYTNSKLTNCVFDTNYASCTSEPNGGLYLKANNIVVTLDGCSVEGDGNKLTDIFKRSRLNSYSAVGVIDGKKTGELYTSGTFITSSITNLNALLDDSFDITFLNADNYSKTFIYNVTEAGAKIVTAEGTLKGMITVPEDVTFLIENEARDKATITAGTVIRLATVQDSKDYNAWKSANITAAQAENCTVQGWVAAIGDDKYYTLQDAADEVTAGQTIKLLANIVDTTAVTTKADVAFTLDLNNFTYTNTASATPAFTNNTQITVIGGTSISFGNYRAAGDVNGIIFGTKDSAVTNLAYNNTNTDRGTVAVHNGTVTLSGTHNVDADTSNFYVVGSCWSGNWKFNYYEEGTHAEATVAAGAVLSNRGLHVGDEDITAEGEVGYIVTDNTHVLNLNGTIKLGTVWERINGTINISSTGSLKDITYMYASGKTNVTGGSITIDATVSGGQKGLNVYGKKLGASVMTVSAGGSVTFNGSNGDLKVGYTSAARDGKLVLTGKGSAFTAADKAMTVQLSGTLEVKDQATLTVKGMSNAGAIAMDASGAKISFSDTWSNTGTLTVDMTGATANQYLLVENTGSTAMTLADYGTVNLSGTSSLYVAKVIDNDLYAVKVTPDMTKLAVNHDWAGTAAGTEVVLGGTTYYYGYNAFDNMADAAKASSLTEPTLITVGGTSAIATNCAFGGGSDVTIKGTALFNWQSDWFFIGRDAAQGDVNKLAKVTFDGATIYRKEHEQDNDSSFNISGAKKDSTSTGDGELDIINGSKVTTEWIVNKNVLNVNTGSTLTAIQLLNVAGRGAGETQTGKDATAYLNATNATIIAKGSSNGSGLMIGANAGEDDAIGIANFNASTLDAKIVTINEKGTLNATGASAISSDEGIINKGVINFGSKDAAFAGNFSGSINGGTAGAYTGKVNVIGGTLKLGDGQTVKACEVAVGSKTEGVVDANTKATLVVGTGATLLANGNKDALWIGAPAVDAFETAATNNQNFQLIVDGGTVNAGANGFTVRNTGYVVVKNGGYLEGPGSALRNAMLITGTGSTLDLACGNLYGETGINAKMTVEKGAVANLTQDGRSFTLGGEGEGRPNRRGTIDINGGTVTAENMSISAKTAAEENVRGVVNVNNGVFAVGGTMTNNGQVNITGTSKVSAGTFTGNLNVGKAGVGNETTLTTDGLTMRSGHMLIADGSTVTLSGDGFDLGAVEKTSYIYNAKGMYNDVNPTGYTLNIKDAEAFKVYAIYASAGTTVSVSNVDYLDALYLNTYGGTINLTGGTTTNESVNVTGILNLTDTTLTDVCFFDVYEGLDGYQGGTVNLKNSAVNVQLTTDMTIGTKTKSGSKYYVAGETQTATLNLVGSTITVSQAAIKNAGAIKMDYTSSITVNAFSGANGTITVDMDGATASQYKLIDNTGSTAMTLADYGTVTLLNGTAYNVKVIDNDLYAVAKPIALYDKNDTLKAYYNELSVAIANAVSTDKLTVASDYQDDVWQKLGGKSLTITGGTGETKFQTKMFELKDAASGTLKSFTANDLAAAGVTADDTYAQMVGKLVTYFNLADTDVTFNLSNASLANCGGYGSVLPAYLSGSALMNGDININLNGVDATRGTPASDSIIGVARTGGSGVSNSAIVNGNVNIDVKNSTISGRIVGTVIGDGTADQKDLSGVTGNVNINVEGSTVGGVISGSSQSAIHAFIGGTTTVTVKNSTVNSVIGGEYGAQASGTAGAQWGQSVGKTTVNIINSHVTDRVGGKNWGQLGDVEINISGGTTVVDGQVQLVGRASGKDEVGAADAVLNITGGTFNGAIYGSQYGGIVDSIEMNIANADVNNSIYGAKGYDEYYCHSNIKEALAINVTASTVAGDIVGICNATDDTTGESSQAASLAVTVNSSTVAGGITLVKDASSKVTGNVTLTVNDSVIAGDVLGGTEYTLVGGTVSATIGGSDVSVLNGKLSGFDTITVNAGATLRAADVYVADGQTLTVNGTMGLTINTLLTSSGLLHLENQNDLVMGANASWITCGVIVIDDVMTDAEISDWKRARGISQDQEVRALTSTADVETEKTVVITEEGGKTVTTTTDTYVINLTEDSTKVRQNDLDAPVEEKQEITSETETTKDVFVSPVADIVINNYTANAEVRGDIIQESTVHKITVNNNADSVATAIDLAITGSLKAVDTIIVNNNKGAVLNGGSDQRGFVAEAKNITVNNDGHAVVNLQANNIVIRNATTNTLSGYVTGDTITFSGATTEGRIVNAEIAATTSVTFADSQILENVLVTAPSIVNNGALSFRGVDVFSSTVSGTGSFDWDLAATGQAHVNDYTFMAATGAKTITVNANQTPGTYVLAENAATATGAAFTLVGTGLTSGAITVGDGQHVDDTNFRIYTLAVNSNDQLVLTVAEKFDGIFYNPNWSVGQEVNVNFRGAVYTGTVGSLDNKTGFYMDRTLAIDLAGGTKTIAAVGSGTIAESDIFKGANVIIAPDGNADYQQMTIMGSNIGNGTSLYTFKENSYQVVVDDGHFKSSFIAGDTMSSKVGTNKKACFIDRDGSVTTTINGGVFDGRFTGGSYYAVSGDYKGKGNTYLGIGNGEIGINLTINGGSFGVANEAWFYAGNSSIYEDYTGSTVVNGDINFTINADSAIAFGEHVICGSQGAGRVYGDLNVSVTGDGSNLTFASGAIFWGGCSGDGYDLSSAETIAARKTVSSVTGNRTLTFNGFTGAFDARVALFETLSFTNGTNVNFTSDKVDWREVLDWELDCDSFADLGSGKNVFAGDTLSVNLNGWNTDETVLLAGSETVFADFASLGSVTLGEEEATWNGTDAWVSKNYKLTLSEDKTKIVLGIGIKA